MCQIDIRWVLYMIQRLFSSSDTAVHFQPIKATENNLLYCGILSLRSTVISLLTHFALCALNMHDKNCSTNPFELYNLLVNRRLNIAMLLLMTVNKPVENWR